MSARVSNCVPMRNCGPSSRQKKIALEVDLNVPLYDHCSFIEIGTSAGAPVAPELRGGQQRTQPPPVTIDVDSIDDDVVVLSSSRDFAEARNNSRRGRSRSDVIDVELVESSSRDAANSSNKRRRIPTNQPIIDCEALVIPDRNNSIVIEYGRNMAVRQRKFMAPPPPPPPPPPPAPEPTFSCPVCMGPFVEETSTKCGHIFCKACVKKAISVWRECPVCRTKLTMRNTIRVRCQCGIKFWPRHSVVSNSLRFSKLIRDTYEG